MKTIIFTRGNNVRQQVTKCEEYATQNGLEVVGRAKTERDLTVMVLGGNAECVLVSSADRISRRRDEYNESKKMFKKFGVELVAVEGAPL